MLGVAGVTAGQPFRTPPGAPHLFAISTLPMDGATLTVKLSARLYGPGTAAVARCERPRWSAWLSERCGRAAALRPARQPRT